METNTKKTITKITMPNRDFFYARISSGRYQTSSYYFKDYTTKSGLSKGLKAHRFDGVEVYNGMTWNAGSRQFTLTFDWD